MQSRYIIGYTLSNDLFCHALTFSIIEDVILDISDGDISTPYNSCNCPCISLVLNPLAYNAIIFSSIPLIRLCLLLTICGSKLLSLSLGTSISISPCSVIIFLVPYPLRLLFSSPSRLYLSYPK